MKKVTMVSLLLGFFVLAGAALAGPPPQAKTGQAYTVQKDDWLSKIAEKYYGDMLAYPAIVVATNAKAAQDTSFAAIGDPDLIEVGQKLWIPDQATPLVIDLEDGTRCLHAGYGATLAFDGKRLNYTCPVEGEPAPWPAGQDGLTASPGDEVGLLGDLTQVGGVWMAEKATIGHDQSGFFLKESEMVAVRSRSYRAPGLSLSDLRNMTYQGIYEEPVLLSDGKYVGEPFVEGAASRPMVDFIDLTALGDLDGDGADDAAVLLAENSGGSGLFVYLAAVLPGPGAPLNAGTYLLGDRVQLKALAIQDGQILVNMITQGADDPFCCPTLEVKQRYQLQGEQLALVFTEEVGKLSPASLAGTTWVLESYGSFTDPTPVLEGTEITAVFSTGEQQVSGSAGCNSYFASFSGGDTTLSIGPAGATKMACAEALMQQESAYLAALETVNSFQFWNGRLLLIYEGGLLTFAAP